MLVGLRLGAEFSEGQHKPALDEFSQADARPESRDGRLELETWVHVEADPPATGRLPAHEAKPTTYQGLCIPGFPDTYT